MTRTPHQKIESMKQGQSTRAQNGRYRIKFDPAWSPSMPFQTFTDGTAGPSYGCLTIAVNQLNRKAGTKMRWSEWT